MLSNWHGHSRVVLIDLVKSLGCDSLCWHTIRQKQEGIWTRAIFVLNKVCSFLIASVAWKPNIAGNSLRGYSGFPTLRCVCVCVIHLICSLVARSNELARCHSNSANWSVLIRALSFFIFGCVPPFPLSLSFLKSLSYSLFYSFFLNSLKSINHTLEMRMSTWPLLYGCKVKILFHFFIF